jgi:hypothetical protein
MIPPLSVTVRYFHISLLLFYMLFEGPFVLFNYYSSDFHIINFYFICYLKVLLFYLIIIHLTFILLIMLFEGPFVLFNYYSHNFHISNYAI